MHRLPAVVVVGGGLAGLAAASTLGQAGLNVTLLESRKSLGGRATSYVDAESGVLIDNCQHVSMGCCTNLKHLCAMLQIEDAFRTEHVLYFISPEGTCTRFQADPLPAPLHLSRAFWRLPDLSFMEKFRFARAVHVLAATPRTTLRGQDFQTWLKAQGQSDRVIRNVWEVVLISALSESLERIDAAYAQKVFVDGFLTNRHGWEIEVPVVSLDELYSQRAIRAMQESGVEVHPQSRVTSLVSTSQQIEGIVLQDGREICAEEFILAVPQHQLSALISTHPVLQSLAEQVDRLESAPITSVHLWFDRPITDLPHAVLVDRLGQWLFARGKSEAPHGSGYLYQVVISASHRLSAWTQSEVIEKVVDELAAIWPEVSAAKLLHQRMITERRAVFSATPGVDRHRPAQQSPIPNLQLAGDWTKTDWPATMEGAVRSGYLAAANILKRYGMNADVLQPGLRHSWLARWLWRHH